MLIVGFIKQIMDGEGYSVVYLIWLITNHFAQISLYDLALAPNYLSL